MRSGCEKNQKKNNIIMIKSRLFASFVSLLVLASGLPTRENENSKNPVHIIQPPIRCPEGMKPDANGRCRKVWERSLSTTCVDGEVLDEDGICRKIESGNKILENDCFDDCLTELKNTCLEDGNQNCMNIKKLNKRDVLEDGNDDQIKVGRPGKKTKQFEALKSERRNRKKYDGEMGNERNLRAAKDARSKHFLIMLKKKKMQMMKPKPPPPPPPPPHHHPPHHHHPESEEPEEEEEEPEEEAPEEQPAFERLFFGDEACIESKNLSQSCQKDAEMVENVEPNKDFKEWKPPKSSESSESSDTSSSSDSEGESESESEPGSKESEDEILERAIKIKLMKIFRMKQRYGPALRRWLVDRVKEYEDSFSD